MHDGKITLTWVCAFALGCGENAKGAEEGEAEAESEDVFACPKNDGASDVSEALEAGQIRAGRVVDAQALIGGDSSDGMVGDFKIYNSLVQFIVQNERLGNNYIPYGGAVIDADLMRESGQPAEDRIDEYATAFFVNPFAADSVCVIQDGSDGEAAIIRAVGVDGTLPLVGAFLSTPSLYGLQVSNEYTLRPDENALQVVTHVRSTKGEAQVYSGDFILMSDDGVDPYRIGPGFDRAGTIDAVHMVGVAGEEQQFAYGFYADEPTARDKIVTPLLEGLGSDDMALFYPVRLLTFNESETVAFTRYLALGRDLDELNRSRYPAQGIKDLGPISGTVTAAENAVVGARVHFVEQTAGYISFARTDEKGRYDALLPVGSYTVTATGSDIGQDVEIPTRPAPTDPFAHGYSKSASQTAKVTADQKVELDLAMGAPGHLNVTLQDEQGNALPGKLTLSFVDGSDPTPPDPILGERNPYDFAYHQFWTTDGTIVADIEPGTYAFTASYGFEHELATAGPLAVAADETTKLTLVLASVVDSSGYLQGDHHMHGGPSIHGEVTMEMRVVTNIAEGLHYFVASDHDRVIDYEPTIAALGLESQLASVQSNEISTFNLGHTNPYPLDVASDELNGGATPWWEDLTPEDIFADGRAHGAEIIQINHGWNDSSAGKGYFSAMGYDALTGVAVDKATFSSDFDAMETKNGKGEVNEALFNVYLGLLNHGVHVTPTGVSDSHHRIPEAGSVRTYVEIEAPFDLDTFADAVQGGRTVVSGGPFIRLVAEGEAGPGGTVMVSDGDVTLDIAVSSPSWIPVERIRIYQGQYAAAGESAPVGDDLVVMEWNSLDEAIPDVPGVAPLWLDEQVEIPVTETTWFVVRADGSSDLSPVYTGSVPFAHTAAIFVEVEKSR